MKILYPDKGISFQKYGGISRYFCEIIKRISDNEAEEIDIAAIFFDNYYFCDWYNKNGLKHYKPFGKLGKLINRLYSVELYLKKQHDVVHHTHYNIFPEYFFGRCKHVITIHDMIPELGYLDDKKTVREKKKYIYKADYIIAVSENTKKDILSIYPDIQESKISVIYHGTSIQSEIECDLNLPLRYILYVGQRGGYKNFKRLLYAFSKIDDKNIMLVCFGGGKYTQEELKIISELSIDKRVKLISGSDKELVKAYHDAQCFVYPSLYEGFGIPILEAWKCKCPVVLSNASCFPEIAGDAGIYFDPYSESSICNTINNVLKDDTKKREIIQLGFERLKMFSWDEAAQKTADIYHKIINDNNYYK